MKDVVKIPGTTENFKIKDVIIAFSAHFAAALIGYITTRAVVLNSFLPFGLSFLGGCPLSFTPAAAIGVFLGYFIPAMGGSGFRYIAGMLALLAAKLLLSNKKRLSESPVFLSVICFSASILTSLIALNSTGVGFFKLFGEAAISAGGTYFISKYLNILTKPHAGLAADELAAEFLSLSIILLSLGKIGFNGISLGNILGIAIILSAAKYGGIISGSISGTAFAFSMLLGGANGSICIIYAFIGLISGIFSLYGKYVQTSAALILSLMGALTTSNVMITAKTVVECALACAIFLILPQKAGIYIGKLFSVKPQIQAPSGFKKSIIMRLNASSDALCDVSDTVEQVSNELKKINAPDFGAVISAVEQDACAGCKLRVHCWESRRDDTVGALLSVTKAVKGGSSNDSGISEEFKGRCLRVSRVADSTKKHYLEYTSRIAAESRIEEVRSVISDQFDGISEMLAGIAEDIENDGQFDNSAAEKAAAALKNLNIRVNECTARTDKYGRMCIEFKIKKDPELVLNKLQIMKLLSVACEKDFDVPTLNEISGNIFVTLSEHAAINVEAGVKQITASGSNMCGDAYKCFSDGKGHFITVLSDGMGTGGRAAVDGAMASGLMSRLLKAGFGYDCSLKILNSSMLFKSTDESLATIDIVSVDLFSGKTELLKAGAAPTVIRRSGKVGKAESTSLPAGILREISFDKATLKCRIGDIIVMMSDGAVCEGTDWIKEDIENWTDGTAEELAEKICEGARRRRTDNHEDDITVIALILQKNI